MNRPTLSHLNRIASLAFVALLSACGGGGSGNAPAASVASAPVAAPAPAGQPAAPVLAVTGADVAVGTLPADLPAPPVSAAPPCPPEVCQGTPYNELASRAGSAGAPDEVFIAPDPAAVTGGAAPYPDLRMLPTRIMPFEPVVYGDVSTFTVTSVH